jgi:HAD superfamily hydrolase (TIGR01509 family)
MRDRIEAVLLDMGGVLIPEVSDYGRLARDVTLRKHLASLGVVDPEHTIVDAGARLSQAYRALEARCTQPDPEEVLSDLDPAVRRALLVGFRQETARPPYPHVREVVVALARCYRLGLVSNTVIPGDHHARHLRLYGILPHFRCALWSANFGRRKPDPTIVRAALARLDVAPGRAIFVGDKLRTDIRAARAVGMRSVWLRRDTRRQTDDARPDFVIRDLRELPRLLASL